MTEPGKPEVTYWDYIKVEDLLNLQGGIGDKAPGDDETLFITVHQVYELWFKIALRDLGAARDLFNQEHVPDDSLAGACRRLERMKVIFQLCALHFPLIETMTTRDYLEFRDNLFPANGGQSIQFREIEILFGLDAENERIPYVTGGSFEEVLKTRDGKTTWALERIRKRLADRPSFKEAVDEWLFRTPLNGSRPGDEGDDETVESFIQSYLKAHRSSLEGQEKTAVSGGLSEKEKGVMKKRYEGEKQQAKTFLLAEDVEDSERGRRRRIRCAALFIEIYRELPLLAWPRQLLDLLVAVEQSFIAYRQRHARMAERIIGRRIGTGGSSGADYLDQTALAYRIFKDLWAVRTLLIRRDLLPDPEHLEVYGFRFDKQESGEKS